MTKILDEKKNEYDTVKTEVHGERLFIEGKV